ncbi:tRNA epoxyqueuosine(34) reductase QueG [uncultured Enterococcus sp.]|uniref:tRNA epoxyqueuosine(34) reductase QueG n=1 Tax=uncultured Enterococcus sp. TaxID=167972 RepID=UPI0025F01C1B|nr:tRNA epoxyqueuosine(34) reductase QueG [uncultured Enterococcus sp.]
MHTLKERIIAESKRIGIDKIGFTTAEPFADYRESLYAQKEAGHTSGFEHPDIEERIDPSLTFDQPKSIISIALAYPTKLHEEPDRKEKRGQFARASWGIDYHDVLKSRLNELIAFIKQEAQQDDPRFKAEVDTGEFIDVAVAQRAGLGFIGKNGLLITEEFGSFVYLGEIVTNLEFEADTPIPNGCGSCTRCITGCPTTALLGNGQMNAKKCLSYQTQTKGMMPIEYRKKIRNIIYGCDICQLVCPYNKGKDFHFHAEMEPKQEEAFPKLVPMLQLSNREFKEQFGHLAGSWRGKKPLQRNALMALANLGAKEHLPEIMQCLKDPRPVIRATAVWAIGELTKRYPEETILLFEELLEKEQDEMVLAELTETIARLKRPKRRSKS